MFENLNDVSILLVIETNSTRNIMSTSLKLRQAKAVHSAGDGETALVYFQQHKPDIIVTELDLTPMSGLKMTQRIRGKHTSPGNRDVPIILMSGNKETLSIPHVRDAGFNELLMVPFSVDTIVDRILFTLNNPRQFIDTDLYAGPDRRRYNDNMYRGDLRRKEDAALQLIHASADTHKNEADISPTCKVPDKWPEAEPSAAMAEILFDHYIKHHELMLQKLRYAQEATKKSLEKPDAAQTGDSLQNKKYDQMWHEVINMFVKTGISEDEIFKIEGIINVIPESIKKEYLDLTAKDHALQTLSQSIHSPDYKAASQMASTLQSTPNPLSGLTSENYKEKSIPAPISKGDGGEDKTGGAAENTVKNEDPGKHRAEVFNPGYYKK